MVRVKICGITRLEDALEAVAAGADALGFVFTKKSPRYISPTKAQVIIDALPPFVSKVGVFVNEKVNTVRSIKDLCRLDALQLHGDEDHCFCHRFDVDGTKVIKAFRVRDGFDLATVREYKVAAHLFDAFDEANFGGSGKAFRWDILKDFDAPRPVILSGGLTPDNVAEAIGIVRPYAVDVSSGVEDAPGIKNKELVTRFIQNVRSVGF